MGSAEGSSTGSGGRRSRWLGIAALAAVAIGAVVAGRRVALEKADREFEERLRSTDLSRD